MKRLILLFAAVLLLGECTQQNSNRGFVTRTGSIQKYALPVFADSAAFTRMKQFFPLVDTLYKNYAEQNHFPSIAYGVIVGNQLVYAGATGVANVKDNLPASTRTLYRIASMSKSFTGMAILKLRDEGRLSLADPVSKHIPEFEGSGSLTTDAPVITILNLLTMSAGFPEDNPWGDRQLADTDQDLLDQVHNGVSFSNVPGVAFEYSNLGFALLGKIVTNVSGMPYQKYITESILKPIGMNDSKWEYSEVPSDIFAPGYLWQDGAWKDEPLLHDGSYGAMGGLICSIEDFSKYVSLHLSAWPPRNENDNGPVKRSSIREMQQPWRMNVLISNARTRTGEACPSVVGYGYGLGWRKDCNGTVRISHSGGLPGYGSEWRIYPEYNMGVVSFSNHRYGGPGFPNAVVLDTLIRLAGIRKRETPPSDILNERKEQLVALLPEWKEEQDEIFAENFYMDSGIDDRRKRVQDVFKEAGAILRTSNITCQNQLRGSFVFECEKKNVRVFFTLTPEPEATIQQLDVELE
jgi:CubicO group peptidase (beta-lactamase class C family)